MIHRSSIDVLASLSISGSPVKLTTIFDSEILTFQFSIAEELIFHVISHLHGRIICFTFIYSLNEFIAIFLKAQPKYSYNSTFVSIDFNITIHQFSFELK